MYHPHTPFIVALFTIARTWKQPRCPMTDAWIKMWYIYTMEYYSDTERNKIRVICIDVDGPRVCNRVKTKNQISYINAYMWNLEK